MRPFSVIYCVNCMEKLWAYRISSNAQACLVPAQPEVPLFMVGTECCPFCNQEIYLKQGGTYLFYVKDERSGRMDVG